MSVDIKIGTRGSKLALWQAEDLNQKLTRLGHSTSIQIIKTKGDIVQNLSFDKLEGKGFFTKELEDALLNNEVDIAVHSMKDLPTVMPSGLVLAGVSERADPSDTLIIKDINFHENRPYGLCEKAIIGTSSFRRQSQIKNLVPDCEIKDLRGNVPTRVAKLDTDGYDAIILAQAGLDRLAMDLSKYRVVKMNNSEFIPAPAQGVMAYQVRESDTMMRKICLDIHHSATAECTNIERKVLNMMDGGCQLPLGVHCKKDQNGNFHAVAALGLDKDLKRTRVSQSTSSGMAELIFNNLSAKK